MWKKLKNKFSSNNTIFTENFFKNLRGLNSQLTVDELKNIERDLIKSDIGLKLSKQIINKITASRENPNDIIKKVLTDAITITGSTENRDISAENHPKLILVVGVNGSGKTTSVAKIAHLEKKKGNNVGLIAADTFRAAAREQLEIWAKKIDISISLPSDKVKDPAAVVFTGITDFKRNKKDVIIIDTAGRLDNQQALMDELKKIKRTASKLNEGVIDDTILVIDATVGRNGVTQAMNFHKEIGLTGIMISKLDGSATGGIIFELTHELKLPIKFLGLGEKETDIEPFDDKKFVSEILE